jgi:hypothetical protein
MHNNRDIETARAILDFLSRSRRFRSGTAEYSPEWILWRLNACSLPATINTEGDEINFAEKLTMRLHVYGDIGGQWVVKVHALDLAYALYQYCFGERLKRPPWAQTKGASMRYCIQQFRVRLKRFEKEARMAA